MDARSVAQALGLVQELSEVQCIWNKMGACLVEREVSEIWGPAEEPIGLGLGY